MWAAAVLIGVAAFAFRLLSQRGLSNDHYMHMAWAQQVLLGDLPGRDFVDPGMPLAYGLSAVAQWLMPGPFSEVILSSAMLGLAASATCLVVWRLTGSILWGTGAALLEIAFRPRFYSFPKILVPAATLLVLLWYFKAPSRRRMAALAVWTVAAGLLRHDLGLYSASAVAVGLAVFHGRDLRGGIRTLGTYAAMLLVAALPYLAFVQTTEGIVEHARNGLEFSKAEAHQFLLELPPFPSETVTSSPREWTRDDASLLLAYLARGLTLGALLMALVQARTMLSVQRAGVAAAIVFLSCFSMIILRHSLPARVPDLAAVLAIVGAWTAAELVRVGRTYLAGRTRVPVAVGAALLASVTIASGATLASAWVLGDVGSELKETRVQDGWGKVRELVSARRAAGTTWPWAFYWPAGELPDVVEYIASCTAESDRLLVTWPASEYYYFSRRAFATGHSQLLAPRAFTAPRDQDLMVARLERHRVPVVLVNETLREEFVRAFPLLDAHLRERYTPAGRFTIRGGSEITIATMKTLRATRTYGADRWPCGFL